GRGQRLNQRAIYEPIVKWGTTIDAKVARQQVRRAIRTAMGAPPGPVHFELPQSETTRDAGDYVAEPPLVANLVFPGPDRADLKPALDVLKRAHRPVLLVGLGVYWCKAAAELVMFAEKLGAPVLTTTKCKGVIPEDHPLRAGCIIGGLIERELGNASDLIITIGLDAVELQPKPWPYKIPVLSLASIPSGDGFVPAGPEIVGDLKSLLACLAGLAPAGGPWGGGRPRGQARCKEFPQTDSDPPHPARRWAFPAARRRGRPRRDAAQHHRDLRCRRQPLACGAEMGVLRAARISHLERPRLHGLCG